MLLKSEQTTKPPLNPHSKRLLIMLCGAAILYNLLARVFEIWWAENSSRAVAFVFTYSAISFIVVRNPRRIFIGVALSIAGALAMLLIPNLNEPLLPYKAGLILLIIGIGYVVWERAKSSA